MNKDPAGIPFRLHRSVLKALSALLRRGEQAAGRADFFAGLTFADAQEITGNFSWKKEFAQGPYGRFFWGWINGQHVSVLLLGDDMARLDYDRLRQELDMLSTLDHPNLARILGYCCGKTSVALCLEDLPNGSLQRHLSDESSGLDWRTRYRIIKGICEASKYKYVGLEEPVDLLLLEPSNILLDGNMEPKLVALGWLQNMCGAFDRKYLAPEHADTYIEPEKAYVFSLGVVMMEIMTGPMAYTRISDIANPYFIDQVQESWMKRLWQTCSGSELEFCRQQVKGCINIALSCADKGFGRRPNIMEVIDKLNQTEHNVGKTAKEQHAESSPAHNLSLLRMDDKYIRELKVLEHTVNGKEPPHNLSLMLLQIITKNFSEELIIGSGGCGVVYKGILTNGIIAVKKLFNSHTIDDKMFHQEVQSMIMINHQNTVRFVGYCSHTEEKAIELGGKVIMAQTRERLLCFEYIGNGSLDRHLTDELRGLEWHTRYKIIQGICEGLQHLHKEKHIIHMDLKPANILLDDHLVPKITDFGLSRPDDKSQTMSAERFWSLGYCAPEYLHCGKRSPKSDIYSLGVIIMELVTGSKRNLCTTKVHRRWKHRWNKSTKDTQLGYPQVAKCLELAQRCIQMDPVDRPNIWDIVDELNKMDSSDVHTGDATEYLELEDMLGIEPLELHLPFELNKQMSCSVELTNDTDDYFAFRISTTSLHPYRINSNKDILPPRSKCSVTITLQALEKAPPHNQSRDEFSVQSTRVDGSLTATDITGDLFREHPGRVVDDVNLVVILDAPTLPGEL